MKHTNTKLLPSFLISNGHPNQASVQTGVGLLRMLLGARLCSFTLSGSTQVAQLCPQTSSCVHPPADLKAREEYLLKL